MTLHSLDGLLFNIKLDAGVSKYASEVDINALYDIYQMLWDAIWPHNFPETVLMNAVKGFFKINRLIYNCRCHSIHCSMKFLKITIWSESCLFFIQFDIYSFGYSSSDDFGHDLTRDGKRCYSSLIVAVIKVAFLWYFNEDSIVLFIWYGFFLSQMSWTIGCKIVDVRRGSVLNNSAFKLSYPRVFHVLEIIFQRQISGICGGSMLMFRSAAGSLISDSWVGDGLFRNFLKWSVHRSSICFSDDSSFPLLSLIGRFGDGISLPALELACHSLPLTAFVIL